MAELCSAFLLYLKQANFFDYEMQGFKYYLGALKLFSSLMLVKIRKRM